MARFPGSTHDAFVWRQSALAHNMKESYEAGDHDSRLIGNEEKSILHIVNIAFTIIFRGFRLPMFAMVASTIKKSYYPSGN